MATRLPASLTTPQRWTIADARVVLDAFERSRLSITEFARREGLDVQRLRRWAHRLRDDATIVDADDRRVSKQVPRFIEVPHPGASTSAMTIEVVLLCGRVLRVRDSIAPTVLRALIDVLDEGTC